MNQFAAQEVTHEMRLAQISDEIEFRLTDDYIRDAWSRADIEYAVNFELHAFPNKDNEWITGCVLELIENEDRNA